MLPPKATPDAHLKLSSAHRFLVVAVDLGVSQGPIMRVR
jgi:hypothetical protein